MRVVLYTGKGGVGKTTTSAAHAAWAADRGARVLVASADAAHSLGDVLDAAVGPEPVRVASGFDALEVDVRAETERHWGAIREYLVSLFRHQGIEEVIADELALLPGAEELTTLLAVEARARTGDYDLAIVDCAPTDSALRMLTLPEVARGTLRLLLRVQRAVAGVVTPLARNLVPVPLPGADVFRDAEALLYRRFRTLRRFVTQPETTTRLVMTPERMTIDEALRTHTELALFDLRCDAVVMNRLLPPEATEEEFFRDWAQVQAELRAEVGERFAPLPVLEAPLRDDEVVGLARLIEHGAAVFGRAEPRAVLSSGVRLRFERLEDGYRARLPLPHAAPDALDVAKLDDRLLVSTPGRRRSIALPRRVARLELMSARLSAGTLEVCFSRAPGALP